MSNKRLWSKYIYVFKSVANMVLQSPPPPEKGTYWCLGIFNWLLADLWRTLDAMMKSNMNASARGSVLGGFSFEADSLAEFSEFDSTSVVLEYQAER